MQPLGSVLKQAVINEDFIIQIQLLGLFRSIFFTSSFRKKGKIEDVRLYFKELFASSTFVETMLEGVRTPFAYVRSQFISFISSCI
jgi:hypothetical protein